MSPETITSTQLEYLLNAEANYKDPQETTYTSPFLRLIVSAERGSLTQSFTERYFAPGEIVFREGDAGDSMYLIWSGRAAIVKGDLDSPTILAFRKPGEIFGEMALLEHQPRSATVIALDHLRMLEINRYRFDQLLRESPGVSRSIMEVLSARLRRVTEDRSSGERSQQRLSRQVLDLQSEKRRLEELQSLRQETTELILHDLRNPLSAVAVSLKMLTLMLPEEALRANEEIIKIAQTSCDRMQRLVDSLLDVSRMEEGEMPFVMAPLDLKRLIEDVVCRMAILAPPGAKIYTNVAPSLPNLVADQDKIERVLINLLDNALKYLPETGQIAVEARMQGDFVQISVSDNGPGIPEEDRQRIFERFAQVSGQRERRRGFGLGLTYCRLAVERHGGRIWVEPGDEGRGSRFVFTLPLKPAEAASAPM